MIRLSTSTIDGEAVQTVNARELHESLGVGKDFSTWVKDRIVTFGFSEGTDFVTTFSPISGKRVRAAPCETTT